MAEHYFSKEQTSSPGLKKIRIRIQGDDFELYSSSGIFSKDALDPASRLLIENAPVKDGAHVLDLGCGYGAVGIALLRRHKGLRAVLSDVNARAVEVAKKNIGFLGLGVRDVEVRESDGFSKIPEMFDAVLLNPPYAAGREVCYRLIDESFRHLNKGGVLYVVARHNKGGSMLEKRMEEAFGNVTTVAKKGGFRVYAGEMGELLDGRKWK